MRISDKLLLLDKIGRELQSRFGYDEINAFLAEFNVDPPKNVTVNSKWIYSKTALQKSPTDLLIRIARELNIEDAGSKKIDPYPPENWKETKKFRLFISHISKDNEIIPLRQVAGLSHYL
jgi:hypothetical protein